MQELLWFVAGCAATVATILAIRAVAASKRPDPSPEPIRPRRIELGETRSLRELSESLGDQLANLATGIEGEAQLLCESVGEPHLVVEHAEELWETVRRLRFFSEKLQSSSDVARLTRDPTDVTKLLAALVLEIEDYSSVALQVSLNTASSLPLASANAEALRMAIFFLIESVFDLEPNAVTLHLQARSRGEDDDLVVQIDIEADVEEGGEIHVGSPPEVLFSYLAAQNLLAAQSAKVTLDHVPGLNAMASITLAATPGEATEISEPETPAPDAIPHHFGGVLVMEGNPTIRHMLARELHTSERNVIVCADGMAAESLFGATPERFELLILEQESRRRPGERVATRALEQKPGLKVILVTPAPGAPIDPLLARHPSVRVLHKPFGLMELRDSLASTLGPIRDPAPVPAGHG